MAERKSGSFIVNNNTGTFSVPIDADQLTDGQKNLVVQVRRFSTTGPIIGTLSEPIIVNDKSFTPQGTLIRTECRNTSKWGVYADGAGSVYDQLIELNSTECGYIPEPVYNESVTGPTVVTKGQRFVISITGGKPNTRVSWTIPRNDSALLDASGNLSPSVTVNTAGDYVVDFTFEATGHVRRYSYKVEEPTTPPVSPTYELVRSASSVNEGGSFTVTFNTNQAGSFPYTISGVNSADINGASLSGSVTNGQVLTFTVTADASTEGSETFTIKLDNNQASASVTINDTSTTPNIVTRTVNWSPSAGSLALFVANRNFIGWMGDITKSNLQVDNTERNTIVYDPLMRQKITELIEYMRTQFGLIISESSIDTELNNGIDSFNSIINDTLSNNTSAVYLLTEPPKLTNQNSFVNGGKIYTKTTLKYSAVNFGFANILNVSSISEEFTTALVNALNNKGITVTPSERTQIKNLIVAMLQLLSNLLNSVTDTVDLYDYTEHPA